MDFVNRLVVLVSHTEADGQIGHCSPIILHEVRVAPGAHPGRSGNAALADEGGTVQYEVCRSVSGVRISVGIGDGRRRACAEEIEAAHRTVIAGIEVVLLLSLKLNPELEGVIASQPGEVISV